MASEKSIKEPVSVDADWRQRVKTEERCAKQFESDWASLSLKSNLSDSSKRPKGISPAKYYGAPGGWIVRQKTLPDSQSEKREPEQEDEDGPPQRGPTGHLTARSSARLSHSLRLNELSDTQGLYRTSSRTYGARLPMEQFGVAEHGIRATPITNLKLM